MNESNNTVSFEFAITEMKNNGDKIRSWAQSDNPVLKAFASEVVKVSGSK